MPKTCKADNCNRNVWGGGYCPCHQNLRTDKKPKSIKKVSEKGKAKLIEKKQQTEADKLFYADIWEERPHYCENCGKYLGSEPLTLFFDHLLEKADYPELRHVKENIMLLCWQDHGSKTSGFPPPKVKERRDEILKKYYPHKLETND